MDLLLHTPEGDSMLSSSYDRAFANATELFMVTAYLTAWNSDLKLNHDCKNFRVIIGKDFGITRKAACSQVLLWLPPKRKGQFLVADGIGGFHPKAVFWKECNGKCFAIIGSSNLTKAAFESNYEANICCEISVSKFEDAKKWVKSIEKLSIVVSEDWVKKYRERPISGGGNGRSGNRKTAGSMVAKAGKPLLTFKLPRPKGMVRRISERREQLTWHNEMRTGLERLFRRCANGKITSDEFYELLPDWWNTNRLQGQGFQILGKHSNFRETAKSFIRVLKASKEDRDDVVTEEIDRMAELKVATRKSFFSEMLCLAFPDLYPVWNQPVINFLREIGFKAPRAASEGVRYLDLSRQLRFSLLQNPNHPAQNLAELDAVLYLKYPPRKSKPM